MIRRMIGALAALVASANDAAVEALAQTPKAAARFARAFADPYAAQRAELLQARAFIAADGKRYPVGPCGYVPKSAQFDPARARRRNRNGGAR
ncbi:MAG: hypothetical protein KF878_00270 [Planctomycetes bacterium]|nr:hypothetical protein [Planctomycetota bacterium]